jgi:hypothetical protein
LYGWKLYVLRFRLLNSSSYIMSNELHSSTSILATSWSTMVTMISSEHSLFDTLSTISWSSKHRVGLSLVYCYLSPLFVVCFSHDYAFLRLCFPQNREYFYLPRDYLHWNSYRWKVYCVKWIQKTYKGFINPQTAPLL